MIGPRSVGDLVDELRRRSVAVELVDAVDRAAASNTCVTGISIDSRTMNQGDLFCCVRGSVIDGHDLAAEVVRRGAAALLVERPQRLGVPEIVVDEVRPVIGFLAASLFGHPSRQLATVGVTGTNGKTTVTHLLRHVLADAGLASITIGTLDGARTTPEAPELHARLAEHVASGGRSAAIEVSSHGLDQRRVDGTAFRVAVFTNLAHDHLDYHETSECYAAAKARLFTPELAAVGVVNLDDRMGRRLFDRPRIETVGYRVSDARIESSRRNRTDFTFEGVSYRVPITGAHNLSNLLAVITTAKTLGLEACDVAESLRTAQLPLGRFQRIDAGQPFDVVVDYAHTPDALEFMLLALRPHTARRLTVVFGCGGDRDPTKRAEMGRIASRLADRVVLTADNPRTEPLERIIGDVMEGVLDRNSVSFTADRSDAIREALASAGPGDTVLLAGKGHETTQTLGCDVFAFHDPAVARDQLGALGWTG